MEKVVVVVLNYMNYKETFQCVDSMLFQKNVSYEIIIVDNGSSNGSYAELRKRYRDNHLIHVLHSHTNYGFAKGNNIGINYAKRKLSADFVLLLNSDTELIQDDYLSILMSKYRNNIAVIGSEIIQKREMVSEKFCRYVDFPDTLFFYLYLVCGYYGISKLTNQLDKILQKKNRTEILAGSCLMLTPSFFKHYKGLYPRTFLYAEEELLYISCQNAGLCQYKTEEAAILHKGGKSSKYFFERMRTVGTKYLIASYKYVLWESFKFYLKRNLKNILQKG